MLELSLTISDQIFRLDVENQTAYKIRQGVFWTDITIHPGHSNQIRVDGLPNAHGAHLLKALEAARDGRRNQNDSLAIQRVYAAITNWLDEKFSIEASAKRNRRWITHEMQTALEEKRPDVDVPAARRLLKSLAVRGTALHESMAIQSALSRFDADNRGHWASLNAAHVDRELAACKDVFDKVECQPLTEEQARAAICFDNKVQVVAAAGSGKTSTMVAKAAYAIYREIVAPDRIVLLAFNKRAAEELKERAVKGFERLQMTDVAVEASTFHALGLQIIGRATGEKPNVPDWATDTAGSIRKLAEIIDVLKDRSPEFRRRWDLFRFVYSRDLPAFGSEGSPDVWDDKGNGRILTARGERVRSEEESRIANWLFLNGVNYVYEPRYKFKTADEDHRQYHPDFYYPDIDVYHEHFALDAEGHAPPHFADYVAGVEWKRQLHKERGTSLFETTSAQFWLGKMEEHLTRELTQRGVVLDPNPSRPVPPHGKKPMEERELLALVRTFISHAKSNCLSISTLRERIAAAPDDVFKHRHRMFLDIASPAMEAWDEALAAEEGIDFEDMLNQAAEHLENNRYDAPYELVMADEFQDASRARARLCRALVQKPGRYLFAVGDDWQSINRFAGADLSVMTGFRSLFGHAQILKLEQSFRCPQALCDVSSDFVSKNPQQIKKQVRAVAPVFGPVLQAFQVENKDQLLDAVDQFVMRLAQGVRDGSIPTGQEGKVSVFVLGRYNAERQYVPARRYRFQRWVDVSFLTIHRSKGSEADYVILPEMLTASRGRSFPSTRADDSVLTLAMPPGDEFPLGEERRLFYVALTRARRSVAMFTVRGQRSSFVRELEADGLIACAGMDGKAIREEGCPSCKQGVIIQRTGSYGEFKSCSNFPTCAFKPKERELAQITDQTPPSVYQTSGSERAPKQKVSVPFLSEIIERAQVAPAPLPAASASGISGIAGLVQAIQGGAKRFEANTSRSLAILQETSATRQNAHMERVVIESAMNHAKLQLEVNTKMQSDPMFRKIYEGLRKSMPEPQSEMRVGGPTPLFDRATARLDPAIEIGINEKLSEMKSDRSTFLRSVSAELSANPALVGLFASHLRSRQCGHYLESFDLDFSGNGHRPI